MKTNYRLLTAVVVVAVGVGVAAAANLVNVGALSPRHFSEGDCAIGYNVKFEKPHAKRHVTRLELEPVLGRWDGAGPGDGNMLGEGFTILPFPQGARLQAMTIPLDDEDSIPGISGPQKDVDVIRLRLSNKGLNAVLLAATGPGCDAAGADNNCAPSSFRQKATGCKRVFPLKQLFVNCSRQGCEAPEPTPAPTAQPTPRPTGQPTAAPTARPTASPAPTPPIGSPSGAFLNTDPEYLFF